MKATIKALINFGLSKMGLKIVQARLEAVSYRRLFDDLALIINKPNPLVLDVGVNTGQTIDALQAVFEAPKIYGFEPSTEVFSGLEKRDFGSHVSLYNYALGARAEEREFINYEWSTMSSFLELSKDKANRFSELNVSCVEQVEIKTVDQFLSSSQISRVDLLKIDTQGFDHNVLLGAQNAFNKGAINYVMIELNFVEMYEQQGSWQEIISSLEANDLYLIDFYEKVREAHTIAWCTALFGRRPAD